MLSIQTWLLFIPAALALAVYPGPNNLLALSTAAKQGFIITILAGIGRLSAFAILIALCGLGLGTLLAASETYFILLKWVGGIYLIYIGLRMVLSKPADQHLRQTHHLEWGQLARQDFLVAITNPKAIIIFTAFFPQFLKESEPVFLQFTLLGITFLLLQLIAISSYAFAGAYLSHLVRSARGQKWLNRGSGVALISAGLFLTAARR
ncbi:LysE family translocator [Cohaesibacter celericrescens]|uniref:Lysine transporter LysE n=1 Tax=Cohaesibacter celericrescens TaxID=2067669 RepID=A0A2N5XPE2_9HYPH|nr:LysE family translocator [Cohaesibacter celericrescens]PLW76372.1 hypothetical protein C0081_15955 [Cohaesibacter celericrescens]